MRNILQNSNDSELLNGAVSLLTNETMIKSSLVFPHQIDLALEVLRGEFTNSHNGFLKILTALNTAYELSIPNLTELFKSGKTAVVFDSSGSMSSTITLSGQKRGSDSAIGKAALIATTLAKGIGADVYHFADTCKKISFNPLDSINTIKNQFLKEQGRIGYGTNLTSVFNELKSNYDRVFLISDMQCADRVTNASLNNAHIYSIDITGYGTTAFAPNKRVYSIFGYSSDIYELVKKVEIDPNALIKEIESIVI